MARRTRSLSPSELDEAKRIHASIQKQINVLQRLNAQLYNLIRAAENTSKKRACS